MRVLEREAFSRMAIVRKKISRIGMTFPGVSSYDFKMIKNKWSKIPHEFAVDVFTMGIHLGEKYRSVFVRFSSKEAELKTHYHPDEYEYIYVLEGELIDEESGMELSKGDSYVISPGKLHHIKSKGSAYYYIAFTESKKILDSILRRQVVEYECLNLK